MSASVMLPLVIRQGVEQRCVDLQQAVSALLVAGTLQTVVNNGGDFGLIRPSVSFSMREAMVMMSFRS